jgi:hypothetical protein
VYLVYDKKQRWYRRALPAKPFVSVTRVNPDGTALVEFARKPYVALRVQWFWPHVDSDDWDANGGFDWLERLSLKFEDRLVMAVQTTGGPSHHADSQNSVHRLILVEASDGDTTCGATIEECAAVLGTYGLQRTAFDPTVFDYSIARDWQYAHYYGAHLDKHSGPAIDLLDIAPSTLHTAIVSLTNHRISYDVFIFRHPKHLITEGERRIYMQYLELLRTGKLQFAAAFPDEPFQHFVEFTVS